MPRTICDLGDAHIRLQAPEGWMQVEPRGSRVILSDAGCSAPIFLEPLPTVEAVDTWIAALVTRKNRLHDHRECSKPDARRFVLTITSREGVVARAYHLQRVPSSRSRLVWVAASIDLDGDASRAQLLAQVFPGVTQVPNVADDSGLRQYIEAEGFTLKLPRTHSVAAAADERFQLREGEALFGWLKCGLFAADAATVTETIDELQRRRGAIVQEMSGTSRLVMVPSQGDDVHDCALFVEAGERYLVFSLEKSGRRDPILEFFRRLVRELRPWAADFHGYWTAPHSLAWRDFKPAPPPAPVPPPAPSPPPRPVAPPPSPDLRTEWKERLSGAVLHYKSSPSGSQPRGFFSGGREVTIHLYRDGTATWEESGFVSTTLPGMYSGGPYRKRQSGTWIVQALDPSAWLVLHLSQDGNQRLPLGRSGDKVTLDGTPYSVIKV
jgi:hypothetical protein